MEVVKRLTLALIIIGAINWGLIGFFQFDLVATLFGGQNALLSRVIYALVGISGLACLPLLFNDARDSMDEMKPVRPGNVNYSTEFGEEPDLSEMKDEKK